jgi:hypothetical protein
LRLSHESAVKDEKHDNPRISTSRGVSIDLRDKDENAEDST